MPDYEPLDLGPLCNSGLPFIEPLKFNPPIGAQT